MNDEKRMAEPAVASETAKTTFIERMAQQIGTTADADYIFAAPVEREGVTVVPVAKAVYWFGGGSGQRAGEKGYGGGGGLVLKPIGYIEIAGGRSRFRPTRDSLAVAVAAAPAILLAIWKIAKAVKNRGEK